MLRVEERFDELIERSEALTHLVLNRRLSDALYRRVTGGIPPVQLQALAVLAAGDLRMRELARRLGLATSTVTRLVDRLEAAGLAERRTERPDRRSVLVGLTAPGREALRGMRRRLRWIASSLMADLTPHEQGELLRLLAKLGSPAVAPLGAPAR
jgi:DNA-binding MarR family transcriptional regulator